MEETRRTFCLKSTLKIGIIGCGGIANGKHMPSLGKLAICRNGGFLMTLSSPGQKKPLGTMESKAPESMMTIVSYSKKSL